MAVNVLIPLTLFRKIELPLWTKLSYVYRIIQLTVLYDTETEDNSIFKNSQDKQVISYLSKHLS